uniref:amino acid permease C-terminal domain-containing protein n=1 Tax=Staphylococcus aureus TaxID=1280 RepID=UPI00272E75AD
KVPLSPIIPLIASLAGSFVLINTLFTQFILAIIEILITALGIPVYYSKKKQKAT